jgi:hypothetical protein
MTNSLSFGLIAADLSRSKINRKNRRLNPPDHRSAIWAPQIGQGMEWGPDLHPAGPHAQCPFMFFRQTVSAFVAGCRSGATSRPYVFVVRLRNFSAAALPRLALPFPVVPAHKRALSTSPANLVHRIRHHSRGPVSRRVDVDFDPALTKCGSIGGFGELQFQRRPVGRAIVLADLPLFLKDLVEIDAGNGGEAKPGSAAARAKLACR